MNIAHICTSDIKGGAARAAYNLHRGLISQNINSKIIVSHKYSNDPNVIKFKPERNIKNFFKFMVHRLSAKYSGYPINSDIIKTDFEIFSNAKTPYGLDIASEIQHFDIINLHWIANFIDYSNFFNSIGNSIPIVWTLHDMNPFTGGCHYSQDCNKYINECYQCPQITKTRGTDIAKNVFLDKQKTLTSNIDQNLTIVSPSKWLASKAKESCLFNKFPIHNIKNGIDTQTFKPYDKTLSREQLGIPVDSNVVLYLADNLSTKRKGVNEFLEVLTHLNSKNNFFIIFVGNSKFNIETQIPFKHFYKVNNNDKLSKIYSAADIFVITSLQDNLPNTVIESLCCATPVIGFRIGGIPDIVEDRATGILVEPFDTKNMALQITNLIQNKALILKMGSDARDRMIKNFSLHVQAREYINLYSDICKDFKDSNY